MKEEYMSSAEIRKEIADLKIRLLFQLEFEEELEKLQQECAQEDAGEAEMISAHREEILRRIDSEARKRKAEQNSKTGPGSRPARRGCMRAWNVIAVAAVMLLVSIGSALATIHLVEAGMLDVQIREKGAVCRMIQTDSGMNVPEEWQGKYYLSYIPEGYYLEYANGFGVSYIDGMGGKLKFDENLHGIRSANDTENVIIDNVMLNDVQAMVTEKDGWITIIWSMNDRYFVMEINEDRETALRVAVSVSLVE